MRWAVKFGAFLCFMPTTGRTMSEAAKRKSGKEKENKERAIKRREQRKQKEERKISWIS